MSKDKLLEVKNLKTFFYSNKGKSRAVDGIDFEIYPGETLGLVGESGCGKSVTALSIMRLIQDPPGKIVDGEIRFESSDLLKLKSEEIRKIRGKNISMIFQDPMTSLNPVFTVGDQITEAILVHKRVSKKEAMLQAEDMLQKVDIPLPRQRLKEYPFQFSGGMRQRIMIAIALSCSPKLLIADEPTTALDVTIQAQVINLINNLKDKLNMSILLITHDLGVITEMADRVAVMYAGNIVEYTDTQTLLTNYKHPYTYGLINSVPQINQEIDRLTTIPGTVPNCYNLPKGCKYNTRCPLANGDCFIQNPEIKEIEKGHHVRCWHYDEVERLKENIKSHN